MATGAAAVRGVQFSPGGPSTPVISSVLGNVTSLSLLLGDDVNMTSNTSFDDFMFDSNMTSTISLATTAAAAEFGPPHPMWLSIILGLLAGVIIVVTVLGNITVLLAFGLERTIRQPTNYFLASLAVSDLLIGTFSMPLYTQYLLFGEWPLGQWLCDLWLSLDWTVCLTSQYTVFLITMDRYLSVKIPAKYRNWRTERKVLLMISVTWILPTAVFFTSVIGWQFFVGKRTVGELECEVQFMSDAMFMFLLTIGYFWITLCVIGVLYAGIYKVALDLQRKSDAKHKKLQSTMELAGDGPHHGDRANAIEVPEGGSNNNSSGADSNVNPAANNKSHKSSTKGSNRKSVKAALPCPLGAPAMNTTSFSTKKGGEKDDDRSSSPAFASDDENSSSGGAVGAPKSPLSSGVYIGRPNPSAGIVNSALFANTGGLVRSLHGDLFFSGHNNNATDTQDSQTSIQPPPPYSEVAGIGNNKMANSNAAPGVKSVDALQGNDFSAVKQSNTNANTKIDEENSSGYLSNEKQTTPLLQGEINKGSRYIDEENFVANLSSENRALLPDISKDASQVANDDLTQSREASSPLWKRRHSLPKIVGDDGFFVDDDASEFISGENATTLTSIGDTPPETKRSDKRVVLTTDLDDDLENDDEVRTINASAADASESPNHTGSNRSHKHALRSNHVMTDTTNGVKDAVETSGLDPGLRHVEKSHNVATPCPDVTTPACKTPSGDTTVAIPHMDANEESSRSDTHCLSTTHRRRHNKDTRLHTFVKSVRSRNSRRRNRRERKSKSENRARKALRTISIILGAFILCWTPYHIVVMIMALCKNCVNMHFYSFTYWMCYLNSPINPFCYAFANAQFKRTFLRIMRFDWHRT